MALTVAEHQRCEDDVVVTSFWRRWCWPIMSGQTRRIAWPVALVVGSLFLAVNQGAQLLSGDLAWSATPRIVANYLIPYIVSSIGYLKAPQRSIDLR